ncbi:MAG: hypothetical protein D3923_08745 [Candidatus Electrothrix sp. AR3]|nr:hypothetical protein [Candidatus Electrothrix sp. AR3]
MSGPPAYAQLELKMVQKLLSDDGAAEDQLGYSVSVDGDTAVIGANYDDDQGDRSGSAYVFVRSGTEWIQQQKLIAPDGAADDMFGSAVSVDGDTIVIGNSLDDDKALNAGSAYAFTRSGTDWSLQQKFTALDGTAHDRFAGSVSIDGDTIVIGAANDDEKGRSSGSAYVFTRTGETWTQQEKLVAYDASNYDNFGTSVSVDSDTIAVGAWADDSASGSVYVFTRSGTGWNLQQKIIANDAASEDRFGGAVSLSQDTVLIGSHGNDENGNYAGAAYVFLRSDSTWNIQQKIVGDPGTGFGRSVSLSGDTAVIGSPSSDDYGKDSGAAYVFTRSGEIWTEQRRLIASDGAAGDIFGGYSNSIVSVDSNNTILIGSLFNDNVNGINAGAAYMFDFDSENRKSFKVFLYLLQN